MITENMVYLTNYFMLLESKILQEPLVTFQSDMFFITAPMRNTKDDVSSLNSLSDHVFSCFKIFDFIFLV